MIKLEIDEHIKQSLDLIEKKLIDSSVRKALKNIASPIKKELQEKAPKDTGLLKKSITIATEINKRKGVAVAYVGIARKNAERSIVRRGLAMEYGNVNTEEQPFLQPVADHERKYVLNEFNDFLSDHLDALIDDANNH